MFNGSERKVLLCIFNGNRKENNFVPVCSVTCEVLHSFVSSKYFSRNKFTWTPMLDIAFQRILGNYKF
jgi:hypothetical protein